MTSISSAVIRIGFVCIVFQCIYFWCNMAWKSFPEHNSTSQRHRSSPLASLTSFNYIDEPTSLLPGTQLLLLIISAPHEFTRRLVIRRTWARSQQLATWNASRVFVVGQAADAAIRWRCREEQSKFGDLLTDAHFVDSYRNLTRKVASSFFWVASQSWKDLRVVAKIDSDCFVRVEVLSVLAKTLSRLEKDPFIAGYTSEYIMPIVVRYYTSKWFLSKKVYPHSRFLSYANGPSYILSLSAVQRLINVETLQEVMKTRAIHLEDVYLTGIVRQRLNIKLIGKHDFFLFEVSKLKNDSGFMFLAKKTFVSACGFYEVSHISRLQWFIDNLYRSNHMRTKRLTNSTNKVIIA